MRIDGYWMPSLLQSRPRCSSHFPRSRLPRRHGTPSLRHALAATVPARQHCRHFARSGRTWPSIQVRTLITLLSISTLYSRGWCSSAMTPTGGESRREALLLHPREVQADRSVDRVSAIPLCDVDQRGDRSPQGHRRQQTTDSLRAYHHRREATSHSGIVGGLPG
jgi:hypothetical protein